MNGLVYYCIILVWQPSAASAVQMPTSATTSDGTKNTSPYEAIPCSMYYYLRTLPTEAAQRSQAFGTGTGMMGR